MALIDDVKARVSTQRLIELTNPDGSNATSINDTILGYACTDASAEFEVKVGVSYDNTKATHLANIIDGVIIYLMKRAERWNRAIQDMEDEWISKLNILRLTVGGNVRISPETNSELTPTRDKRGVSTSIITPDFDPKKFDTLRPNSPFGTE